MNKAAFLTHFTLWQKCLVGLFFLTLTSCQYLETTKVDSEELYKSEIETIAWDDVDQYPLFTACDEAAEKPQQRACFQQELSNTILSSIANKQLQVSGPMLDTISLGLSISNAGEISIAKVQIDSLVRLKLPEIEKWLQEAINNTPKVAPALKRGIPVNTSMMLPIILRSAKN